MAHIPKGKDLVHLYKRLLRSCESYPSKNRGRIYDSIREEFRVNASLDANSAKATKEIQVAFKGLEQLHQFDGRSSANFSVQLEQNPFPKPDDYKNKRIERVEKMLEEDKR